MRFLALFSLGVLALGCPQPPMPTPDAGRLPPDAGPPRVVDGGTIGPAQWGTIELTQRARTSGSRITFSSTVQATFVELTGETPNPCVERPVSGCTVRICNVEGAVIGLRRRPGTITIEGALLVDRPDGGVDGGLDGGRDGGAEPFEDGGVVTLVATDAGAFAALPGRLFTDDLPLIVHASGDEVPAFTSPLLLAPAQPSVQFPRCGTTCPVVSRALPLRVEWTDAPVADVRIELVGRQVSARCVLSGLEQRFELDPEVLGEFLPSLEPGDATLIVAGVRSVGFDAGTWSVTLSASTPTLIPLTLE
jgi:hypothetical protein